MLQRRGSSAVGVARDVEVVDTDVGGVAKERSAEINTANNHRGREIEKGDRGGEGSIEIWAGNVGDKIPGTCTRVRTLVINLNYLDS